MQIEELIRRELRPHYGSLITFPSTRALESSPLWSRLAEGFRSALETVQTGHFAPAAIPAKPRYRVLAWNIERGKELEGQIEMFRSHDYLRDCDALLLIETDVGMARSGNVDVARRLARELGYHYAFAPCYLSLVKGSGVERDIDGENDLGLHGNAILSRYPMRDIRRIGLRNGIDKLAAREKRLGSQTALSATIDFPGAPATLVCVHLDANSTQRHRMEQMRDIVDAIPNGPTLLGGDWNTTTYNSSTAFHAIMGYWLRVFMGPNRVIRNHFLHPYRWFERDLFQHLERRGFDYRESNHIGEHTIFYDVEDLRQYKGLSEWVPQWCFPFIRWALRDSGGGCPLKIDWFAARQLQCADPRVLHDVNRGPRGQLSDHDAIGVEIIPSKET
jgi:endonuclease/exonuclease/phosphatase family metal-dependent hydrolase